jgi:hypothetical protein
MPVSYVLYLLVLLIFIIIVKTPNTDNNLANKMRVLSQKSLKLQQDNEKSFYKAHIKEWKETPFYQFVFDTIKKVAEKGENGVIINYYFEKSNLSPTKPYYTEAVNYRGYHVLYACFPYYFTKDEKDNILQDYATHESYFYGLEKYLKEEGFYVKDSTNDDSITISW